MHSTRRSFSLLIAVAAAAAIDIVVMGIDSARSTLRRAVDWIEARVVAAVQHLPKPVATFDPLALAPRVRALGGYLMREARAKRVRLMPGWRMVPSI